MIISLRINDGTGTTEVIHDSIERGTNALELLKSHYEVTGQEYAGMGFFITGIGNIISDDDYSWLFFANDEPAQVSADNYILKDTDTIEFRYLSNEESMKYFE